MTTPELTALRMARLIGDAIKDAGLTQAEFARRAGVTEKHVSRVLNMKNGATMATLDYWAFLLGLRWHVELIPAPVSFPG